MKMMKIALRSLILLLGASCAAAFSTGLALRPFSVRQCAISARGGLIAVSQDRQRASLSSLSMQQGGQKHPMHDAIDKVLFLLWGACVLFISRNKCGLLTNKPGVTITEFLVVVSRISWPQNTRSQGTVLCTTCIHAFWPQKAGLARMCVLWLGYT